MTFTAENKTAGWRRFLAVWGITSAIIPFAIFLVLGIFNFEFYTKIGCTVVGITIWCLILAPFYIMDWDERRREKIRQLCKGDALVKLWKISLDVAEDGSCKIERLINAINLADERQYYELEAWTDPEKDSDHEAFLKETRKITPKVSVSRKGQPEKIIKDKTYSPEVGQRINRIIHVIPLTMNGGSLKPWDRFTISYKEKTEKNALVMTGDFYQHRVRHLTDRLHVEILLPSGWRFPQKVGAREKLVIGEEKSPTMGEWAPTPEKPKVSLEKKRTKITWDVDETKLLHIYRITYHALEKK